jgi:predicted lipid-binding transport protein (Tim44 family)
MNAQLLEILFFAMVAGVILFRLYSVLGRRTGEERPPQESTNFGQRCFASGSNGPA